MPEETNAQESDLLENLKIQVSKLSGIREPRQRMARLIQIFSRYDGGTISYFLHALLQNELIQFDPPSQVIHLDIVRFREVLRDLGYEKISEIYECATSEEWEDVKSLFQTLQESTDVEDEDIPETFGRKLENLTLGERKQMSRSRDPKYLEMLVFDSHPRVVRELLMNPRVTLQNITRLASRRNCPPDILEEVCRSDRWIRHYNIRKTLVFNPSNPLPISLGLVQHLRKGDLHLLLQMGRVPDLVKAKASSILKKKGANTILEKRQID